MTFGKTKTRTSKNTCGWCGRDVPAGTGFRYLSGIFCSEEHAAEDQAFQVL